MPRGDKSKYTSKQKRQAGHIEKGYEKRGVSRRESEQRAWATVNKISGGGNKPGGGGRRKSASQPARKSVSARKDRPKAAPARKTSSSHRISPARRSTSQPARVTAKRPARSSGKSRSTSVRRRAGGRKSK